LSILYKKNDFDVVGRGIGSIRASYAFHFLPAITINANYGFADSKSDRSIANPFMEVSQTKFSNTVQTRSNTVFDLFLSFIKEFRLAESRIDFTVGLTDQTSSIETSSIGMDGGVTNFFSRPEISASTKATYGRFNYSFKNRYSITLSLREDGVGKFVRNRYNLSRFISFNWSLKDELFLKNATHLTQLNLRISGGNVGEYSGFSNPNSIPLSFNGLSPQTSDRLNVGINFSISNRFFGAIDYLNNVSNDIYRFANLPQTSGFFTILLGEGKIRTEGFESNFNYLVTRRPTCNWRLGANVSYLTKELNDFRGPWVTEGSRGLLYNDSGYPVNSFGVTKQIYDTDGSPLNSVGNRYISKNTPDPWFIFGVSSALSVGKWNFDFLLRGSIGNYVYDYNGLIFGNLQGAAFSENMTTEVLQTKLTTRNNDSDYYLQKASFLRAENIALGYSIENIFKSLRVNLSAIAQNAFVITNYTGQDPEVPNGIDFARYTVPRTFSLRLEIKGF
jgi:iron complex outermembrane receptor protein